MTDNTVLIRPERMCASLRYVCVRACVWWVFCVHRCMRAIDCILAASERWASLVVSRPQWASYGSQYWLFSSVAMVTQLPWVAVSIRCHSFPMCRALWSLHITAGHSVRVPYVLPCVCVDVCVRRTCVYACLYVWMLVCMYMGEWLVLTVK